MANEPDELDVDEVFEEPEAYVTYDIASYPSDLTLSVLSEMWKNGDIEIPDFQRSFFRGALSGRSINLLY